MDIIIRPAETSDFDSVVHILNQVQALHCLLYTSDAADE